MSLVNVTDVRFLENPSRFTDPFRMEITFECLQPGIKEELEWKVIYVGSAEDEKHDQELDSVLVGPVAVGKNRFTLEVPGPCADLIPVKDILGVTVLLLTCSYKTKEFIRIGFYVNNEYTEEELKANPPEKPIPEKIVRNILADKPRVTRFQIPWDQDIPEHELYGLPDPTKISEQEALQMEPAMDLEDDEEKGGAAATSSTAAAGSPAAAEEEDLDATADLDEAEDIDEEEDEEEDDEVDLEDDEEELEEEQPQKGRVPGMDTAE